MMENREFYDKFNQKIKDLDLKQMKDIMNNIIRKVPVSKYEEVLNMFNDDNEVDTIAIEKQIRNYEETFKSIDEFDLYFHATGYEDYGDYYSPWGGDWIWEYTDDEDVSDIIYDAFTYAVELTNKKQYKHAKRLFDLVLNTNYQVLDDDGGDNFEISLKELQDNHLLNISVKSLCLYAIYVTYQCENNKTREEEIYKYFKKENFDNISVQDSFNFGIEILKDTNDFFDRWISLLVKQSGKIEYRLLKEAFEYTRYNNYEKYIYDIAKCHPRIYIDIFDYLLQMNETEKVVILGNQVLPLLDKNLVIRNDISLYIAKYDESNKEKYIYESFISNTNIPNLLRIINNDYYIKYKDVIDEYISSFKIDNNSLYNSELGENILNKKMYYYLQFFLGNFDVFYEECKKYKEPLGWSYGFIQNAVYLWMLLFNDDTKNSKINERLLYTVFEDLGFQNNLLFLDSDYFEIFKNWKMNFSISDKTREECLEWLQSIIDKRVDAIVSGSHRKSYYKAAFLVVSIGEVLEFNGIQRKEEFINSYHKKYVRHSSFRKKLNELVKE